MSLFRNNQFESVEAHKREMRALAPPSEHRVNHEQTRFASLEKRVSIHYAVGIVATAGVLMDAIAPGGIL